MLPPAVVSGGPGALFWMWISSLLGMSTKACEIILGQRYRVKYSESMDEYMCDRSFVMKNALGWKRGAVVLSVACFVLGPWTCCVQTESVTGALEQSFGIDPMISAVVLGVTCFVTIAGGLKRISAIMERVVPFMAVCYILGGLGILITNWSIVPDAFALIFKSAFTPMAGVGGFAGATAGMPSAMALPGVFIPTMPERAMALSPMRLPRRIIPSGSLPGAGARCSPP